MWWVREPPIVAPGFSGFLMELHMRLSPAAANYAALYTRRSRKRQTGQAQIVAVVIALIIGVILLAGVLALASGAYSENNTNSLVNDLSAVETATQAIYSSSPNGYANATPVTVANGSNLPAYLVVGTPPAATALQDSLHSPIFIDPGAANGSTTDNSYAVTLTGLTQAECIKAATQDYGSEVQNITVAAGAADPGYVAAANPPIERMTTGNAEAGCVAGGDEMTFTIVP